MNKDEWKTNENKNKKKVLESDDKWFLLFYSYPHPSPDMYMYKFTNSHAWFGCSTLCGTCPSLNGFRSTVLYFVKIALWIFDYNSTFSLSGVLIFGGSEDSEDVFEVAFKPRSEEDAASLEFCSITSALPGKDLFGAVGVNFFNEEEKKDEISFCGGSKNSDCFALKRDEEHFFHWQRSNAEGSGGLGIGLALQYAAAVRLSADLWWITGGRNTSKVPSDETKLLHRKLGLAEGPKMPEAKYGHCAVDVTAAFSGDSGVNYKYLMLVGGRPLSTSVYLGRWENCRHASSLNLGSRLIAVIASASESTTNVTLFRSRGKKLIVVSPGGHRRGPRRSRLRPAQKFHE